MMPRGKPPSTRRSIICVPLARSSMGALCPALTKIRRRVSGVYWARNAVVKRAVLAIATGILVHAQDEIGEGCWRSGESFEASLESCHEECRRDAFAGDIRDCEKELRRFRILRVCRISGGASENVVVIAGDGVGGTRGKSDGKSGNGRWIGGKQPALNVAGDLQVALHDDAIGDFEHEQDEK